MIKITMLYVGIFSSASLDEKNIENRMLYVVVLLNLHLNKKNTKSTIL